MGGELVSHHPRIYLNFCSRRLEVAHRSEFRSKSAEWLLQVPTSFEEL
jgi:hypothetical protein